ncbi:MAG: hypothetical protein JXA25_02830 [Anaerolineales bacterium]|nr:hypothetical protein [Anaerolineales bacterium]
MPIPVLVHVSNEDPIRAEVEDFPGATDSFITLNNPRRRDGKDLPHVLENVVSIILPFHRINYIELLPTAEEEDIISFIRE